MSGNHVGPIIRAGEVADAAIEAVKEDNPDKEFLIEDRMAYIRIVCDDECILTRESMENALGRSFELRELEINLSSFAGHIEMLEDRVRFYLNTKI